ncbi:LexA family transcriptional regulator [Neisseria bacilliformis]|uniref:LexA family transcriptional regulator n=1 Tax=Neisseria bacilliformis TaxID=267212 RepID=UPI0002DD6859|nr:LexA family transcriptional regulator [Neisseria bacilliformis]QMT48192.1 LexA family transcriptional regulator [Neisseria bacilliformis]
MNRIERVKTLIEERYNGNQTEFARAVGKAAAQVNQWMNGHRNIGNGVASDIEKALDLPRGWLDDEAAPVLYRSDAPVIREGWLSVPRLAATGRMGDGIEADDPDEIVDFVIVLETWARRQFGGNLGKLRIINAKGDSMQDTINPGDVVFADTSADRYDGDGIYVILTPSGLRIKRLHALVSGGLNIISDNKAYPVETLEGAALENLRICGRVKGRWTLETF